MTTKPHSDNQAFEAGISALGYRRADNSPSACKEMCDVCKAPSGSYCAIDRCSQIRLVHVKRT
jgi:hypothetical protein